MTTLEQLRAWLKEPEGERLEFKSAQRNYHFDKLLDYYLLENLFDYNLSIIYSITSVHLEFLPTSFTNIAIKGGVQYYLRRESLYVKTNFFRQPFPKKTNWPP